MMFQMHIIDMVRNSSDRRFNLLTEELIFDIFQSRDISKVMKVIGKEKNCG